MKSAMVEREAGGVDRERDLLQEGIHRFPYFWKLHIMLGQLEERLGVRLGALQHGPGRVVAVPLPCF
jgi:hypothetical protein